MFRPTFCKKWGFPFLLSVFSLHLVSTVRAAEIPFDQGSLQEFSALERSNINDEFFRIQHNTFQDREPLEDAKPVYVATAGPNGALQSVVFKDHLEKYPFLISSDYDRHASRLVNKLGQPFDCRQVLPSYVPGDVPYYNEYLDILNCKFRSIAHYFTGKILQKAFSEGYHVAHLSTSTDINIEKRYRWLKKNNYKIVLLLCGSMPYEFQAAYSGNKFIGGKNQCLLPPNDEAFQTSLPTYFKYADEIHLHWTKNLDVNSTKAAIYDVKQRFLIIKNAHAYRCFRNRYPFFWGASKSYFEMI